MGDRAALDHLVLGHLPAALRFATRLTGDPDAAEELVQEGLSRVAAAWTGFRGEAQFRTWFYQILVNAFRDRARRPQGEPLPEELTDAKAVDPADAAVAGELGETVARLVSMLPPRQREVLVLMAYEQLTVAEVASVLSITEANVHATLHHARSRLRRQLAPYLGEGKRQKEKGKS